MKGTFSGFLQQLQRQFAGAGGDPTPEMDEHLAVALLLAELARADNRVGACEEAVIARLLAERFGLQETEAQALMARAAVHDEKAISLYEYVQALNARLEYPERCEVIEMLWAVAWADGVLDPLEEHRLRKIAGLLYVSDGDFVRAKLKVMARLPSTAAQ